MPKLPDVLYEDETCLVFNKPSGLAVQGGKGVGVSLDSLLANHKPRPLLVHRLDKDTSGVILTAKTKASAAAYSQLLGEGRDTGLVKQYLAVCSGKPTQETGVISMDIEVQGKVKKSETRYELLKNTHTGDFEFSLLQIELKTGRMHQIRRHLAMSGNPVLGDDKYGDFALNKTLRKTMNVKRLLLHASRLVIPSNPAGKALDINAPLPDYFCEFLAKAGMPICQP